MSFGGEKVAPQTAEEIKECETAEGIRRRITRLAYRGNLPIVPQVFNMAETNGLSGEDKYTFLAFEALKQLEWYQDLYLKQCMLDNDPPMMIINEKIIPTAKKHFICEKCNLHGIPSELAPGLCIACANIKRGVLP